MRFLLPFNYFAKYRRSNKHVEDRALMLSEVEIEIEEILHPGDPAFFVAQPLRERHPYSTWQRFRSIDGRAGRTWRIEGQCFSEYCEVEDFVGRVQDRQDNPFRATDGEHRSTMPFHDQHQGSELREDLVVRGLVKFWSDDRGAAKAELIARRALAMRVIDGMVCVAVGEPIIDVRKSFGSIELRVVEGVLDERNGLIAEREFSSGYLFRLEDMQSALAFATELAADTGKDLLASVAGSGSSTLGLAPEGQHLRFSLSDLDSAIGSMLDQLPDFVVSVWHRVDLALQRCPSGHVTNAAVAEVDQLLLALSRCSRPSPADALVHEVRRVAAAAAAWRTRDMNDGDWSPSALPIPSIRELWVKQILSGHAMAEIAMALQIPVSTLQDLHDAGHILLDCLTIEEATPRRLVVAATHDLIAVGAVSNYGYKVNSWGNAALQTYLDENRRQMENIEALRELDAFALPNSAP